MYNSGMAEKESRKKSKRKAKKTFLIPVKGIWFKGYRRVQMELHPSEIYKLWRKDTGPASSSQEKGKTKQKQKVEIDLQNITEKMLMIYFLPIGERKTIDIQQLRKEKWERLLSNLQSVSLKRLFLMKNPNETYSIPYCEDKQFGDMLYWKLVKQRLLSPLYLRRESSRIELISAHICPFS